MFRRFRYFILIFILVGFGAEAKESYVDSLKKVLPSMKADTNKVRVMYTIAMSIRDAAPREAIMQASEALVLAEELDDKLGMASSYNVLGICYRNIGKYPEALENLLKSLQISEELHDDAKAGKTLGNIGNLYRDTKDYKKAMEYLGRAYETNTRVGNRIGVTNNLSDMGIASAMMKDMKGAMEYFDKALKNAEESGDKEGVAIVLGNIANIYMEHDANKAFEYFQKSLKINEELGRMPGIVANMMNLANLHYMVATDSVKPGPGSTFPKGKEANLAQAIHYYNQSIPIYLSVSHLEGLFEAYTNLSAAYSAAGENKKAFDALTVAMKLNDSIRTTDDAVKLAKLGEERADLEKQQQVAITRFTQTKRRNEALAFALGLILLSVFTVFVVKERRKSEKLLLNILPQEVASELKRKGKADAQYYDEVTVLFTDFVNFTSIAETMSPQSLVDELDTCFKAFDAIVSKYKIEKIKTVGDAYLAVSGLPVADKRHAVNVVGAALEIVEYIHNRKMQLGDKAFDIRIGINSGNVVAGIVGVKKFAYDIWGDTVNTAARMEQSSEPGKINISANTYELVKGEFKCTYRGEQEVKNKGEMDMYFVEGALIGNLAEPVPA